jgi:hypothetical protein
MKIDINIIRSPRDFDQALDRYKQILAAEPFSVDARLNYELLMSEEPLSPEAIELEILSMQLNVAVVESLKFPIKQSIYETLLIEHNSSPICRSLSYRLWRLNTGCETGPVF